MRPARVSGIKADGRDGRFFFLRGRGGGGKIKDNHSKASKSHPKPIIVFSEGGRNLMTGGLLTGAWVRKKYTVTLKRSLS